MKMTGFLAPVAALALVSLTACGGTGGGSSSPYELVDVAFGHDSFVAVGSLRTEPNASTFLPALLTSADGVAWTKVAAPGSLPLWSVTFSGDRFVAAGGDYAADLTSSSGVILTSTDGVSWTRVTPDLGVAVYSVAYGGGIFLGATPDNRMVRSTDGVTWAVVESSLDQVPHRIAFGNGVFIAYDESGEVNVSSDGLTWTAHEVDKAFGVRAISFSGGAFFAGLSGACAEGCAGAPDPVARSTDGITWSRVTNDVDGGLGRVAGGQGVLVGASPTAPVRSTDGLTWTPGSGVGDHGWSGVAAGASGFVAVGVGYAAQSSDGATWTEVTLPAE